MLTDASLFRFRTPFEDNSIHIPRIEDFDAEALYRPVTPPPAPHTDRMLFDELDSDDLEDDWS